MRKLWRGLLVWLKYNPLLYEPVQLEHIRFGKSNEYLITQYRLHTILTNPTRFDFVTRVERCIGCDVFGRYFRDRLRTAREKNIKIVYHEDMSLEEFTSFAKGHPILQNDDWVQMRLAFTNN